MKRAALLALITLAGCAVLAGLEDHELGPAGAADAQADANPCGSCAPGYACTDGRCGNEVVEVAASGTHACAVLRAGELWCWGKSQLGALGVDPASTPARCGAFACRPEPARVPGIADVAHVALTDDVTCALTRDGVASCWGRSARGELGHDPSADPTCPRQATGDAGSPAAEACTWKPARVVMPVSAPIAEIVAGSESVCARAGGNVYCWGGDYLAEIGVFPFPPAGFVAAPTRIAGVDGDATSIAFSAAYGHGCALRIFNTVWCWGSNISAELGHAPAQGGDKACIFGAPCGPTAVGAVGASGTSLAAGQGVSCARRGNGTVGCWGGNDAAQLGNGASVDSDPHPAVQQVAGLSNIVAVEMRYQTGFAIDGSAHVWAWGLATNGALGTPAPSLACANGACAPKPVAVSALDGAVRIATARAGGVALKNDGTVRTWGLNDLGQLGHPPSDGDAACKDGPCRESPSVLRGLP